MSIGKSSGGNLGTSMPFLPLMTWERKPPGTCNNGITIPSRLAARKLQDLPRAKMMPWEWPGVAAGDGHWKAFKVEDD